MIIQIVGAILIFGVIVFIHELGHFLAAKACNMRVDEFAIGMGPIVIKKKYGETLYSIRLLPLGGFNRIAGMDPEEQVGERGFSNQAIWKRMIVIVAGATFNIILTAVIFMGVYATYGAVTPSTEPVIGEVVEDGPGRDVLQVNDRILMINGKSISSWKDISPSLAGTENHSISVRVERNGATKDIDIVPTKSGDDRVVMGIRPNTVVTPIPLGEAISKGFNRTVDMGHSMISGLWSMLSGRSEAEVAGPLGVAQMAGAVAQTGLMNSLLFMAMLSLNLGIINLLPVPLLDGGHIVLLTLEAIMGRKLPPKALHYIQMTGLVILVSIFLFSTSQDISRFLR